MSKLASNGIKALMRQAIKPVVVVASMVMVIPSYGGDVLQKIQGLGSLSCTVDMTSGFGGVAVDGRWQGFDVDFCHALAAATLGNAKAVDFKRISTKYKLDAIKNQSVDVAMGMTTWTLGRDASYRGHFSVPLIYDGQGFMAHADSGIRSMDQVKGHTVCVQDATTTQANLMDYLARNKLDAKVRVTRSSEEKHTLFIQKSCDILTADSTALVTYAASQSGGMAKFNLLPQVISREPLTPLVSDADPQWFDIVRWTTFALIFAEQKGITSDNVAQVAINSKDEEVRRFLGLEGDLGKQLGLSNDWAYQVIYQVGNYGQIFDRNLTPLGLERGANKNYEQGGLLYSPPFR